MDQPDLDKHVKLIIGDLALKLAMANAVNEALEKSFAAAKAGGSGSSDGARSADGPAVEGSPV